MSVPADNSRKNNANVVKRFKLSKKHFANYKYTQSHTEKLSKGFCWFKNIIYLY